MPQVPQQRVSAKIRHSAISMAIKKAQAGCESCAQHYFSLAREHGATTAEIEAAIANISEKAGESQAISRRELIKLATGMAAGLSLADQIFSAKNAEAAGLYWGTDSNTASCCGISQHFYIGQMGYGLSSNTDFFNQTAARNAGWARTYEYWGLVGPMNRGSYTPRRWGFVQGQKAVYDWATNQNAKLVGGRVIFADIELAFGGWFISNLTASERDANRQVVLGYMDALKQAFFVPGIYISPLNWRSLLGEDFDIGVPFVLWLTGHHCCKVNCQPCDPHCSTLHQIQTLFPNIANTTLGGSRVAIWQYWISDCGCGDYNVAFQNPGPGFVPINGGGTTFQISG